MEAAGIEPASENVQQESLHTYQVPFCLAPGAGEPATPPERQPIGVSPEADRASRPRLSCISRRSRKNLQAGFSKNVAAIKQLVLTVRQQLIVFHAFYEDRGTSVCISCIFASVESGAPPEAIQPRLARIE